MLMWFIFTLILLVHLPGNNCIMVITSKRNERPQLDGHFVIPELNISSLDTFTMCGRFKTYQYIVQNSSNTISTKSLDEMRQGIFTGLKTFSIVNKNFCNGNDDCQFEAHTYVDLHKVWMDLVRKFHIDLRHMELILFENEQHTFCIKNQPDYCPEN